MGDLFDLGKIGSTGKPATLTLPASVPPAPSSTVPAPSAAGHLSLVLPQPVPSISDEDAIAAVKLERDEIARLDVMSAEFIVAIMKLDLRDQTFFERAADLRNLGSQAMAASTAMTGRLLDRPIGPLAGGGSSASVVGNIAAIRLQMDRLNPIKQGDLLSSRKVFGVKVGDPLRSYFNRFQTSQTEINAVLLGLQVSEVDLREDNQNLQREQQQLLVNLRQLRAYLHVAQRLETSLVDRVLKTEASDPERGRFLKDDLLSNARDKVHDLTTHVGLSVACYLAIDAMGRNNVELIRGLEYAKVSILSVLRTAGAVAQAMIGQHLALDQIAMLADPNMGAVVKPPRGKGNASGQPDLPLLQHAFDNLAACVDEIDGWRSRSSAAMVKMGTSLQAYLDRGKPIPLRGRGAR